MNIFYKYLQLVLWFGVISLPLRDGYSQQPYQDPLVTHINRLPARATSVSYINRSKAIQCDRSQASTRHSLNGDWAFQYAESPKSIDSSFFTVEYDHSRWKTIPVPSNWELEGYGKPWQRLTHQIWKSKGVREPNVPEDYNPTGCYIKDVQYDQSWEGKRVILHLGGITSAVYVWVNGEFVGYSEDDRLPSEFDITDYLVNGKNKIALKVLQWCDGSYIEDQDHWRMSGIHREVALFIEPNVSIYDFGLRAELVNDYRDGVLSVRPEIDYKMSRDSAMKHSVLVDLLDEKGISVLDTAPIIEVAQILNERHPVLGNRPFGNLCRIVIRDAHAWNDEQPYLYTLLLTLIDEQGHVKEYRSVKVGFRTIETKNGELLVNGKSTLLYGVNRHDWNWKTGKAVSYEDMWQDAMLMKQLNVNASRSAHYPNPPEWYEICDQLGIYVMDEANIESHGKGSLFANDPSWVTAFMERGIRMVERDKNHPSIIMWSLGNEAGHGPNHAGLYGWVKEFDPTRPVHLETAQNTYGYYVPDPEPVDKFFTDIRSRMYRTPDKMIPLAIDDRDDRPIIWCEYAHSQGQSTGDLQSYWELIRAYPKLVGAYVWDWRDQLVYKPGPIEMYRHGEDFGQLQEDLMPVQKGLIAADGTIKSGGWEAKKVWQRIEVKQTETIGTFTISNHFNHWSTDHFDVQARWQDSRGIITTQPIELSEIQAGQEGKLTIEAPTVVSNSNGKVFMTLQFLLKDDTPWAKKGYVIAEEQFLWKDQKPIMQILPPKDVALIVVDETISISSKEVMIAVNAKTGLMSHLSINGISVLSDEMTLNFWRPPTDNDRASGMINRQGIWKEANDSIVVKNILVHEKEGKIESILKLPKIQSTVKLIYQIDDKNRLHVEADFSLDKTLPEIPRVGLVMHVDSTMTSLGYWGRGPHENYSDKKSGALIGHYSEDVYDDYVYYVRPQESGHKTDVMHFNLSGDKYALNVQSNTTFEMNILPYSQENIEQSNRIEDLTRSPFTHIYLDAAHMGVGGDNTWNIDARPHSPYRVYPKDYTLSFSMGLNKK